MTNSSKYRIESHIQPGDLVFVRDWSRRSKFDPIFLPSPFIVQELNKEMKNVLLRDLNSTRTLLRHLDDIKECHHFVDTPLQEAQNESVSDTCDLEKTAKQLIEEEHEGETILQQDFSIPDNIPDQILSQAKDKPPPSRSTRVRKPRQRYIEMC